jgi:glycosyltransferase involved in cell wall biosynthesis
VPLAIIDAVGPRIAVIIPCYNDGDLVGETVRSVNESEPVEVAIIDDGSTDVSTREVLDRLSSQGTRVIRHEQNRGLPAARMTGLKETEAPYVFPLDADDLAVPGALPAMADLLDNSPDAALCYGDYLEFGGRPLVRAVPEWLDPYRVAYTNEYPTSALFRRSVLESVGGWKPVLGSEIRSEDFYEDWNLWMTLAESGAVGIHAGAGFPTYQHRIRKGMTVAARELKPQLYRALRERHPALFEEIHSHRKRSDLSPIRKLLYPVVYGGRPRFRFEPRVKSLLDRLGIWTLRR